MGILTNVNRNSILGTPYTIVTKTPTVFKKSLKNGFNNILKPTGNISMAYESLKSIPENLRKSRNIRPIYKRASSLEKKAFLSAINKGIRTAKKGSDIKRAESSMSSPVEKKAFLGTVAKGISTVANSKLVNTLGGFKGWAGSALLEHFTGKFKENRDNAFRRNQIMNNVNKYTTQNNMQKSASIASTWKNYIKNSLDSIYTTQNETLKNMQKQGFFDATLKEASVLGTLKTLGKHADNLSTIGFAANTAISLNNSRKNIQYAAPKVNNSNSMIRRY